MRFVLAIVAFVVAAGMIVLGIAQRTVLLAPDTISLVAPVDSELPFTVIEGEALNAKPEGQTLSVKGSADIFVAYGRTADVTSWLGDQTYNVVSYDHDTDEFVSTVVTGEPAPIVTPSDDAATDATTPPAAVTPKPAVVGPDPAGSDLWLQEYSGANAIIAPMNVPRDVSVIVASDGTAPAPDKLAVSWPLDNSTPWAGPLIVGGSVLLLLGILLYLWAFIHLRRSQGPRRKSITKGPKMPKPPKAIRYKPTKKSAITSTPRGRRSTRRSLIAVVPAVLVGSLALSGCSADFWPDFQAPASSSTPTPTPGSTELPATELEDVIPPVVTVPQLEKIVKDVSAIATNGDSSLNPDTAAVRFAGPALDLRKANYAIRGAIPDFAQPTPVPAGPLSLTLPVAIESWPRTVMTVTQNADTTLPPTALVLTQATPRDNYKVQYAITLEADATIPDVAPASIGAPLVAPDVKLLVLPPEQLAAAYGDILNLGEASQYYDLFDADGDSLREQVGLDAKNAKKASLPSTASIEFTNAPGTGPTLALGTNDSGAIVAVNLTETEVVKPVAEGATVSPENAAKALSGVTASTKGVQSVYGDQLLFYVPAAGSNEKIKLLGFSTGLTSSSELP
ncbi:hypothetical protein [Compostimonas suwonensis]|uniref:DUF8094 domain-containing protein n=1 Tax=Compostimonas suwonensis TaxID=1048394 RepID=A0A2M9BZR1_9MICO|nr:hypothetical protein [Compostimonas suwonensis]PJJ63568.1 hypothetical protein CLV54_1238 [Compostimonas suwonensis]